MRLPFAIIAGAGHHTTGCASQPQAGTTLDGVPVLASTASRPLLPERVFKQLTSKKRKVLGGRRALKSTRLAKGWRWPKVALAAPILLAAAEQDGWFFYAADTTFYDSVTHQPLGMSLSGVAIKRGSRDVVGWSIW